MYKTNTKKSFSFKPPKMKITPIKLGSGMNTIKTIPVHIAGANNKLFRKEREEKSRKKIRNPVKYLVEKHSVPMRQAKRFLAQPVFIDEYWKEDSSGPYVDKYMLDSIGYGWKDERKMLLETLQSTEKVRKESEKQLRKEYGKMPTKKEMEEKIGKLPKKYQNKLRKIQRVMKIIKR